MAYHYIVYADILLALNFFMDFFLIWAAGRFLRLQGGLTRQLSAAALGAVYAVGILSPELAMFYTPPFAVLASLLLLRLAFPYRGLKSYVRLIAVFYLIAFAMAGAALAGASLLSRRGLQFGPLQSVRAGALLFGLLMAAILARRGVALVRRNWRKESFMVQVEIWAAGRRCLVTALIDTGNDLVEPVSGKPVLVCEYKSLQGLLPQGLRHLMEQHAAHDPAQVMQAALAGEASGGWEKRLRLIPFASIGKDHGMLLGFAPDKLIIYSEGKLQTREAVVALYHSQLGKGEYQAVMNPGLLLYADEEKAVSA